jgi:hypothetical protein
MPARQVCEDNIVPASREPLKVVRVSRKTSDYKNNWR